MKVFESPLAKVSNSYDNVKLSECEILFDL